MGLLRTQKFQPASVENPELTNVLLLEPGVGQNTVTRAWLTARNVVLVPISTFPVHSPSFVRLQNMITYQNMLLLCIDKKVAGLVLRL